LFVSKPISARSNATSVTLVAADADADEAKDHFSSVFADNARLRTLVTQLRSQLALRAESVSYPGIFTCCVMNRGLVWWLGAWKTGKQRWWSRESKCKLPKTVVYMSAWTGI